MLENKVMDKKVDHFYPFFRTREVLCLQNRPSMRG